MDKSIQELQQPAATANRDVAFVSRRPIYSRSTEVFAYELLSGSDVLDRAILETLIGESLAFSPRARRAISTPSRLSSSKRCCS